MPAFFSLILIMTQFADRNSDIERCKPEVHEHGNSNLVSSSSAIILPLFRCTNQWL